MTFGWSKVLHQARRSIPDCWVVGKGSELNIENVSSNQSFCSPSAIKPPLKLRAHGRLLHRHRFFFYFPFLIWSCFVLSSNQCSFGDTKCIQQNRTKKNPPLFKLCSVNVRANRLQNNKAVHGSAASSVQGDAVIPESSRSQRHQRSFTLAPFLFFIYTCFRLSGD